MCGHHCNFRTSSFPGRISTPISSPSPSPSAPRAATSVVCVSWTCLLWTFCSGGLAQSSLSVSRLTWLAGVSALLRWLVPRVDLLSLLIGSCADGHWVSPPLGHCESCHGERPCASVCVWSEFSLLLGARLRVDLLAQTATLCVIIRGAARPSSPGAAPSPGAACGAAVSPHPPHPQHAWRSAHLECSWASVRKVVLG